MSCTGGTIHAFQNFRTYSATAMQVRLSCYVSWMDVVLLSQEGQSITVHETWILPHRLCGHLFRESWIVLKYFFTCETFVKNSQLLLSLHNFKPRNVQHGMTCCLSEYPHLHALVKRCKFCSPPITPASSANRNSEELRFDGSLVGQQPTKTSHINKHNESSI